ncbi:hypothetical protein GPECTOR_20g545 [Gonium pectorale]|uniref:CBS domain-containing protein n=1 Tax=Gonium pectorale TaxID=33097 RepID=A0A150GIN7_GONPE|nr:hypothetical protein GPECTOR_20g545 [Gonium pectorale]|eukprot:KXZ49688.1 hypothetical protein GPECTOR_20g545 [Gonium pectorale]
MMLTRRASATPSARAGRLSGSTVTPRARSLVKAQAASDLAFSVRDVMSSGRLFTCRPEDTVDSALELLVANRITGLPVVDPDNRVVGVVSDFDLLALDSMGRVNEDQNLFPSADQSWQAFKEVKKMLAKSAGKKIKDVMTPQPITVRPETNLNDATSILITKKIRRLPVVDAEGRLVGLISRGNIVKAALAARKATSAAAAAANN